MEAVSEREAHVFRTLCKYLADEWESCGGTGTFDAGKIRATRIIVPQQKNSFDCGIYILEFLLTLLANRKLDMLGCSQIDFPIPDQPRSLKNQIMEAN